MPVATDATLLVNRAGTVAVNLPSSTSRNGYPLAIKDISGAADTNNITINRNGSDLIDGLTSVVITNPYGSFSLKPVTGGWIILP